MKKIEHTHAIAYKKREIQELRESKSGFANMVVEIMEGYNVRMKQLHTELKQLEREQ